jgi:hypothetical protein
MMPRPHVRCKRQAQSGVKANVSRETHAAASRSGSPQLLVRWWTLRRGKELAWSAAEGGTVCVARHCRIRGDTQRQHPPEWIAKNPDSAVDEPGKCKGG